MRVDWNQVALEHLDDIAAAQANWSSESGRRLRSAILARGEQIAEYPLSGRMIPEFQVDQLREVIEQGFRILYEVLPDRIEVFGVVHSHRDVFADD